MTSMETEHTEVQGIDLLVLLQKFFLFLRRFWAMVLILAILGGGLMYWRSMSSYAPRYKSEATFYVSVNYSGSTDLAGYSYYYDKTAAKLVADTFPHLLRSETMRELVCQKLGTSYINGSISPSSVTGTNLFVLTVTSADPDAAYDIIRAVMDVYPQVSRQVIGETQLVVSQEPVRPYLPYNSPSWQRGTLIGAMGGFGLGIALLLFMAFMRKTPLSEDDVKKIINLPCLARIPEVKVKRRKSSATAGLLITRQDSDTPFCESFRLLRLKLLRSLSKDDQIIMFTSSVPSEGKSSLAVNTALALAKDHKKVLLVDADLRGPSVKETLNMTKPSNGLGEYLTQGLDSVRFLRYESTRLYVFAGDQPISSPTQLLRHDKIAELVASVRPMFDYIILDTPPCSMMADAESLARYADKVVYVVRRDHASNAQIFDGVQTLSSAGAKICGFAFNRSAGHSSRSGYGYGYGYGYGHYGYGRKSGYGYGKSDSDS